MGTGEVLLLITWSTVKLLVAHCAYSSALLSLLWLLMLSILWTCTPSRHSRRPQACRIYAPVLSCWSGWDRHRTRDSWSYFILQGNCNCTLEMVPVQMDSSFYPLGHINPQKGQVTVCWRGGELGEVHCRRGDVSNGSCLCFHIHPGLIPRRMWIS